MEQITPLGRRERIFGYIYLPVHIFAVPILLVIIFAIFFRPEEINRYDPIINLLYYSLGFVLILLIMFNYLKESFLKFTYSFGRNLRAFITCFISYYLFLILLSLVTTYFIGDIKNPNDNSISQSFMDNRNVMTAVIVILAPIVEEVLFRGVLFGQLMYKNIILAYIVSIFVFCFYHIWQFLIIDFSPMMFLSMLQYIPAGVALSLCYQRTGEIWTPIFLHMTINAISLHLMRLLH